MRPTTCLSALARLADPIASRALATLDNYTQGLRERTAAHNAPTGDSIDHSPENCPCRPVVELLTRLDGKPGYVAHHFPLNPDLADEDEEHEL